MSLIEILSNLVALDQNKLGTYVVQLTQTHKNKRYFGELFAVFTNCQKLNKKEVVWEFLRIYPQLTDSPLFYSNDLRVVVDILLKDIEKTILDDKRGHYAIEALQGVMTLKDYQNLKIRADDINLLVEEYELDDEIPEDNLELFKNTLNLLEG